ncbi:MAG TPA: YicC family protein [Candidatus Fimivivens faecavium]|nr:YicC family protein [Candidatus Fimivivens faecavium]
MVKSMTGYGRAQKLIGSRDITVELKSVNHRYFEFSCRVPRSFGFLEEKLKSFVQQRVSRGKIDCYVGIVSDEEAGTVKVNRALASSYLAALRDLQTETGLEDDIRLSTLVRFSDLFTVEKNEADEDEVWNAVAEVAGEAAERFVAMRAAEGGRMKDDVLSRLEAVERLTAMVEEQSPKTVEDYRAKLYQKLSDVLADRSVDEGRVLTEAAVFAERIAVAEETVRLRSHIAQYREILSTGGAVGRKLDFLTQELNREANTIGSKAQDLAVARAVVEIKSEIEKIREQIQNIE